MITNQELIHLVPDNIIDHDATIVVNVGVFDTIHVGAKLKFAIEFGVILTSIHGALLCLLTSQLRHNAL